MTMQDDFSTNRIVFQRDKHDTSLAVAGSVNPDGAGVFNQLPVAISHTTMGLKEALDVNIAGYSSGGSGNPFVLSGLAAAGPAETTIDINLSMARNVHNGYLYNDGTGILSVQFSYNGIAFTGALAMAVNSFINLGGLDIDTLKLSGSDATTSYRLIAW